MEYNQRRPWRCICIRHMSDVTLSNIYRSKANTFNKLSSLPKDLSNICSHGRCWCWLVSAISYLILSPPHLRLRANLNKAFLGSVRTNKHLHWFSDFLTVLLAVRDKCTGWQEKKSQNILQKFSNLIVSSDHIISQISPLSYQPSWPGQGKIVRESVFRDWLKSL